MKVVLLAVIASAVAAVAFLVPVERWSTASSALFSLVLILVSALLMGLVLR
jgi:hypothetical protein